MRDNSTFFRCRNLKCARVLRFHETPQVVCGIYAYMATSKRRTKRQESRQHRKSSIAQESTGQPRRAQPGRGDHKSPGEHRRAQESPGEHRKSPGETRRAQENTSEDRSTQNSTKRKVIASLSLFLLPAFACSLARVCNPLSTLSCTPWSGVCSHEVRTEVRRTSRRGQA